MQANSQKKVRQCRSLITDYFCFRRLLCLKQRCQLLADKQYFNSPFRKAIPAFCLFEHATRVITHITSEGNVSGMDASTVLKTAAETDDRAGRQRKLGLPFIFSRKEDETEKMHLMHIERYGLIFVRHLPCLMPTLPLSSMRHNHLI